MREVVHCSRCWATKSTVESRLTSTNNRLARDDVFILQIKIQNSDHPNAPPNARPYGFEAAARRAFLMVSGTETAAPPSFLLSSAASINA